MDEVGIGHPKMVSDIALRTVVTWSTVLLFFTVNLSIVALLFYLGWADHEAARAALANPNAPRDVLAEVIAHPLITPGVLMSLIGGSVVELGVVMVLIAKYLFPHAGDGRPRRRRADRGER